MPQIQPGSDEARELFPVTERYAYLNHAAVSPLNTRTADVMHAWLDDWEAHGTKAMDGMDDVLTTYRTRAGSLIGASADEIAFTRNTSEGLINVARGLPWEAGDNLVTADTEFTANVYPWKNLEPEGVEIRRVPTREGRILVDDLVEAMDDDTRLVAVSFVEFYTGYRNQLEELGERCRERDVLLCIDAIQGAGAFPIDVDAMHIDFLSAGAPKWLMGPIGAGIFYCREAHLDLLDPNLYGWLSIEDPHDFFDYDQPLSPTASRFEAGTLSWPSVTGLIESITLLQEVGIENIADYILNLTGELIPALRHRGCKLLTPAGTREERSGIVTFRHPEMPADELCERLDDAGVIVSQRGDAIRTATHFYNNWEDMERLLDVLP